jgi:hypothetical protein
MYSYSFKLNETEWESLVAVQYIEHLVEDSINTTLVETVNMKFTFYITYLIKIIFDKILLF